MDDPTPGLGRLVTDYVAARGRSGEIAPETRRVLRSHLSRFAAAVGWATPAGEVTRSDVERFLRRRDLKPESRRAELAAIRGLWRWLIVEGCATADPTVGITRPRVPRQLPRALRPEAVRATLEVCPDSRARLMVLLMVQEGLRCFEVAGVELEAIDLVEGTLLVEEGKWGHQRLVPLSDETRAELGGYLTERGLEPGPLIASATDRGRGISARHVSKLVGGWLAGAGVAATAHALRHTAATDMLRSGAHLRDVQAMLGHRSLETTQRYLPWVVGGLRQAMGGRQYASAGSGEVRSPRRSSENGSGGRGAVASGAGVASGETTPPGVAALIEAVAELCQVVEMIAAEVGVEPPESEVTCPLCGLTGRSSWMERHHLPEPHCPDCGAQVYHSRMVWHRRRFHGRTAEEICTWAEPHDHSAAGHCLCPLCHQSASSIVWGEMTMATHLARPHQRCPDCDRAFINLAAHRRKAHPWSVATG